MTDADSARAQRLARIEELGAVLETYKAAEPGPRFMGDIPERWMDGDMRWRCPNGHVSGGYIKSEEFGGDCCQRCYSNPANRGSYVRISFPEDTDGPLAPRPVQPVETGRGHRSRQADGTYTECPGPTSYIVIVSPTGGGTMNYHCRGCGKRWSVS